ncbi:hypothetical protein Tco_0115837, partial [Tanacetum coccineum]
ADKPSKTFDELMSTPIDFFAFIMNGLKINNLTQETLLGPTFRILKGTHSNYAELEYDFEECYKALSEKLDWENPKGGDYKFDLTKPLPLVMSRNHQKVPVHYFFNNDLKSLLKLPMINKHYEESHTGENNVEVIRKHRYGYLKDIVVRRADNDLYRFKEGYFPRLPINDIKDMLLLVVQNWLTNLLGDDISNFAIALRMFTRSLVIQKRVKDLQLGVESYHKKINVTRPQTTISDIKKRDPYTPYQDPQGFIYVDNNGRNSQNLRDLPRDIPLDSVVVLRRLYVSWQSWEKLFHKKISNLKILRSLPSEWNTHVVVWRNKPELNAMSFDDLYNNFKIVEQEVKGNANSSSSSSSQNMAFVSSHSSTNEVNTGTANLSDAIVYAFLANQPNGSQLVHKDLEQIYEDDLEEMDLKWQLALLSMRTRRFFQKTRRKITTMEVTQLDMTS